MNRRRLPALACVAACMLPTIAAATEPPTEKQIEAVFIAAQAARRDAIAAYVRLGVARRLTDSDRDELKRLRGMIYVRPRIEYRFGSFGFARALKFDHALSATEAVVVVDGRGGILEDFDTTKLTPGQMLESVGLLLDRFEEKLPIYRPLNLLPYVEKFGKVAP